MSVIRSMSGTSVTSQFVGRRAVITVRGEIDIATIDTVAGSVNGALGDGAAELWIDLSQTEFMDSSGIHLMIDTARRLAAQNRRVAIICPQGRIRRVLDISGAANVLPLFDDRSSADQAA
jgi:anti-sigma B factor antagonist